MRRCLFPCAIILLIALVHALSGCRTARPLVPPSQATSGVYIIKRAWHTEIGFAASELQQPLRALLGEFPTARYLTFGFGDRHYLLVRQRGPGTMVGALWPGPALILMTGLGATPEEAFGSRNVIRVPVTVEQSRSIQAFIWKTLSSFDEATPFPIADGPYGGSVFYAAAPSYSAIYTCNTWSAEALHAGALPVDSTGVEFSGQLWRQAQRMVQP